MPEKPLARLVFRRWRNRESIILVVDMQRIVSNLNGSQALHFAVPVDVLELGEVQLFLS